MKTTIIATYRREGPRAYRPVMEFWRGAPVSRRAARPARECYPTAFGAFRAALTMTKNAVHATEFRPLPPLRGTMRAEAIVDEI